MEVFGGVVGSPPRRKIRAPSAIWSIKKANKRRALCTHTAQRHNITINVVLLIITVSLLMNIADTQ